MRPIGGRKTQEIHEGNEMGKTGIVPVAEANSLKPAPQVRFG